MKEYLTHLRLLFRRLAFLLLLFSLSRLFFFFINIETFSSLSFGELLNVFLGGIRFDLSVVIYANSIFAILHAIPGSFKSKKGFQLFLKIKFVIINSLLLMSNFGDAEYFKFTKKRSTAYILDFVGGGNVENEFTRQIPLFLSEYWYVFLAWFALVFLAWKFYPRFKKENFENRTYVKITSKSYVLQTSILIVILLLGVVGARGGLQLKPLRVINAAEYTSSQNIPLVLNTPFTIFKTLGKEELSKKEYFEKEISEKYFSPIKQYHSKEKFKKMNVVVLILESFSKEYSGFLTTGNSEDGYMPFLDSLMQEGLTFENAYSNGTQSIEAMPSILASLPPLMNNPFITSSYSTCQLSSLPQILKEKGYKTSFFHGATNGSMGFDTFAKLVGIEKYYGRREYNNEIDYDGNWGIKDEEFLQYSVKELSQIKQPFFTTIMTLSSHHPYTIPEKYKDRFTKGEIPIHKVVSYADFALKRFFETASKTDWYDNTLFVITADHTGIASSKFYKNKVGRYAIPIVYFQAKNNKIKKLNGKINTQQADIMPSVLHFLNYKNKFISFGNSVFGKNEENFAVNYLSGVYQLIENDYTLYFDGEKSIGLYNVKKDKLLTENLLKSKKKRSKKMENRLKAIIQEFNNRLVENKMIEL